MIHFFKKKEALTDKFKIYLPIFIGLALLLIGFGLGLVVPRQQPNPDTKNTSTEKHSGGYTYINPLIDCAENKELGFTELNSFKSELEKYINDNIKSNELHEAAVYFRDLNNGPWYGINEQLNFNPASLMKLPVMMAYFKEAETNPAILKNVIAYQRPLTNNRQYIKPQESIQVGQNYTIEDLINYAIIYSDNNANLLLKNNIDIKNIYGVFTGSSVTLPQQNYNDITLNVKSYAGLFRVLYNASYLNKNLSEKALELLSRTNYTKGLVAGVPSNIAVAHKFGEREDQLAVMGSKSLTQLHDCGIIYHPKKPYLLCIMTRGYNLENLSSIIKKISQMVYQDIDSQFK